MKQRILASALVALLASTPLGAARADYVIKDGNGTLQTIKSDTVGGGIQPVMSPVDASGNPFGVSNNPIFTAPASGQTWSVTGTFWQSTQPISAAAIAPVISSAAEASHIIETGSGHQTSGCYAVNLSGVPGFLILVDSATVPADGTVVPKAAAFLPANGQASIVGALLSPIGGFSSGIVAVLTSAITPFTKTTNGGLQGFISCQGI